MKDEGDGGEDEEDEEREEREESAKIVEAMRGCDCGWAAEESDGAKGAAVKSNDCDRDMPGGILLRSMFAFRFGSELPLEVRGWWAAAALSDNASGGGDERLTGHAEAQ